MAETLYYRPEWTCGRYHEVAKVALCYNLIEGMSYFFEGDSAKIPRRRSDNSPTVSRIPTNCNKLWRSITPTSLVRWRLTTVGPSALTYSPTVSMK